MGGRTTTPAIGGIINVSGGVYRNAKLFQPDPACNLFYEDLAIEMGRKGADAATKHPRFPTLWLYAANDAWFSPRRVGRKLSAYRVAGGLGELTMFPLFEATV